MDSKSSATSTLFYISVIRYSLGKMEVQKPLAARFVRAVLHQSEAARCAWHRSGPNSETATPRNPLPPGARASAPNLSTSRHGRWPLSWLRLARSEKQPVGANQADVSGCSKDTAAWGHQEIHVTHAAHTTSESPLPHSHIAIATAPRRRRTASMPSSRRLLVELLQQLGRQLGCLDTEHERHEGRSVALMSPPPSHT